MAFYSGWGLDWAIETPWLFSFFCCMTNFWTNFTCQTDKVTSDFRILLYTEESMVNSMTARYPSPVDSKQEQITTPQLAYSTVGMRWAYLLWLVFARHDCTFPLVCSKDSGTHFMRIETSNNFDLTKFHMLVNNSSQSSSLHTIAVLPDGIQIVCMLTWMWGGESTNNVREKPAPLRQKSRRKTDLRT